MRQPRRPRGGRLGDHSGDRPEKPPFRKQEVNVDRSRKCSVLLPYDTERPIDGKIQRR